AAPDGVAHRLDPRRPRAAAGPRSRNLGLSCEAQCRARARRARRHRPARRPAGQSAGGRTGNRGGAATVSPVMEAGIKQAWWRWARPLGGALILGVLLVRLGGGPFIEGVRAVDARTLALAVGIAAVTTAAAAWRWSLVAHGLRADLPLASAI